MLLEIDKSKSEARVCWLRQSAKWYLDNQRKESSSPKDILNSINS